MERGALVGPCHQRPDPRHHVREVVRRRPRRRLEGLAERHGQGRAGALVAALDQSREKLVAALNEALSAHLEDGFLEVTLPKRSPRRRVEVEEG